MLKKKNFYKKWPLNSRMPSSEGRGKPPQLSYPVREICYYFKKKVISYPKICQNLKPSPPSTCPSINRHSITKPTIAKQFALVPHYPLSQQDTTRKISRRKENQHKLETMLRLASKRLLGQAGSWRSVQILPRFYHENVIDHFNNPRNVGSFDKNDPTVGTGLVGAPACGDVMKLQIKVDEKTGEILDARFKTFGCGSAIASSSVGTRMKM